MTVRTLVTGATRGIGRAICAHLARSGHEIVGVARSADPGFEFPLHLADLQDEQDTARVLAEILGRYEIDNLVNNAGYSSLRSLGELTVDELRKTFEINVRAAFQCAQACAPRMIERGRGRIVNISSMAARGRPKTGAYSSSKAALNSISVCWALELAQHGVTVNVVAPGFTQTEMFKRNNPPGSEREGMVLGTVPMKRPATTEEVAAAVAYVLSDAAAYMTGQTLLIDGGWSVEAV